MHQATIAPSAQDQPQRSLGALRLAQLFVRGLVSDGRGRRRLTRTPDARPWFRAVDPRIHDPIFVLGAPRSGTSFLGGCLAQVPGVSYHFEPRVTKAAVRQLYSGAWTDRKTAHVFRASCRALMLAAGDGGRRYVDKTPEYAFIIPFLATTFPTAMFVHIIRDGRDVAVSHSERPWLVADSAGSGQHGRAGTTWGPQARFWVEPERRNQFSAVTDLERAAWAWRRYTQAAKDNLAAVPPERSFELRYERLVTEPTKIARELAEFIVVDDHGAAALAEAVSSGQASSVDRWRDALDDTQRDLVEAECGPLLAELGY
jgi:hypothetical protein